MTIRFRVKEWCETHRVTTKSPRKRKPVPVNSSYKLWLKTGVNSPTTANQIWQNKMQMIGLPTIEALCRSLKCQPNDLFEFEPPLSKQRARKIQPSANGHLSVARRRKKKGTEYRAKAKPNKQAGNRRGGPDLPKAKPKPKKLAVKKAVKKKAR